MKLSEAVWVGGKLQNSRTRRTKAELSKLPLNLKIKTELPPIKAMHYLNPNEKIHIRPNLDVSIGNMVLGRAVEIGNSNGYQKATPGRFRASTKIPADLSPKDKTMLIIHLQEKA